MLNEVFLLLGGFILLCILTQVFSRILHGLEVRRIGKQTRRGCHPLIEGRERGKGDAPPCKPRPTAPPPSNHRPPSVKREKR